MDRSVDPCQDFYQYSCGNFLNVINVPAEIDDPSLFSLAEEKNIIELKQLLENNDYTLFGKYSDALNKTKHFYNSCMRLTAAQERGITPLVEVNAFTHTHTHTRVHSGTHALTPNSSFFLQFFGDRSHLATIM